MYKCRCNRRMVMQKSQISKLLESENIGVVSFDLFDTLLVRPSFLPEDIFFLLQDTVKKQYGLNFYDLRCMAEKEIADEFVSLDEIWSYIAKKNKIDLNTALALEKLEMQLERDLLTIRKDIKQLYDIAVRNGKRIIVVTDMYLPSDFLMDVLREKGFHNISKVYVSCEEKARKSSGELFRHVLAQESLYSHSELLHIGDNYCSDYKMAIEQNITAVYYPSIWDLMMEEESQLWKVLKEKNISADPKVRILYSFAFIHAYNNYNLQWNPHCFSDITSFAKLLLAPMLTAIGVDLLCNPKIQENYSELLFAARDGFLPKRVYDVLGSNLEHINSKYIYVSRQALCYTTFDSFIDFFEHSHWEGNEYLLKDFVTVFVLDESLRNKILENLTEAESIENLCVNPIGALRILSRFIDDLENYYGNQKRLSITYYNSILAGSEGRQIVFDCGYSGSVSNGLQKAIELPFDKYYLWETQENCHWDKKNNTKTISFFPGEPFFGVNVIFEECFSPAEGSCLGFSEKDCVVKPELEHLVISREMSRDLDSLEQCCILFAEAFEELFRPYISAMVIKDRVVFLDIVRGAFISSPYNELSIFDNIVFPDSHGPRERLSKKTYESFTRFNYYRDSFHGTMFENPDTILPIENCIAIPSNCYNIGIHFHLYNKYLTEEIQSYLYTITYPFDLYITITDKEFKPVIINLFTQLTVPMMQKLEIICTKNRGRDVAPWLVELKQFQNKYDLFCHVHSKESAQYGESIGTSWRQYLFDNLIDGDAVNAIIDLFEKDEKLGLVFPACYSLIKNTHNDLHIPVSGEFGEERIICELLSKMGIDESFARDNYIWSMGTMMWYRPRAMDSLFSLGLTYEDFPEEPIGVGGTIAHAIERIVSLVVKSSGYSTKQFNLVYESLNCKQNDNEIVKTQNLKYYGYDSIQDQIAWGIGVKNSLRVLYYANVIKLKKIFGLIKGQTPEVQSYNPYAIAQGVGVRNAWIIFRKAICIYLLKK